MDESDKVYLEKLQTELQHIQTIVKHGKNTIPTSTTNSETVHAVFKDLQLNSQNGSAGWIKENCYKING